MEKSITQLEPAEISQEQLDSYLAHISKQENILLAIIAWIIVWLIWAAIWATVTVITGYQIWYMAVAIGLWVGYTFRILGKWRTKIFGILSASIALLSCVIWNIFTMFLFAAKQENINVFDIVPSVDWTLVPDAMIATFSPIDLVFYWLAIYIGFTYAFRVITHADVTKYILSKA
jgi:hypothetical protein